MPSVTIPLVGNFTRPVTSPYSTTDVGPIYTFGQKFVNCVFSRNVNSLTGTQILSVEKRPGLAQGSTFDGTGTETFTALIAPAFNNSSYFGAYGSTNSTITKYVGVTNTYASSSSTATVGTVTGIVRSISETIYSDVGHIAMASSDGTGWYYPADAGTGSPTFTAITTSGSPTLTSVSSFTGLYIGQALSGTGIPATARIQAMNSGAGTITMGSDSATTVNATASNSGVTITRTPIAKIISVNFPSAVGKFVFVDGYAFVMTAAGRIYNSSLNDITTWGASDYITANLSPDQGVSLARYKNQIIAFGSDSGELFYNAGNPSGSVLSRSDQNFFKVGAFGANSIVNVEDTIYWLGVSGSRGAAVYKLEGFTPVKVSIQEIDSILNILVGSIVVGSSIYLGAAAVSGNINLFLTNIGRWVETGGASSIQTLLYDITNNIWHGWGTANAGVSNSYGSFHLPAYVSYYNRIYFGGKATGRIDKMEMGEICYYRDNTTTGADGATYNMQVLTKKLNFGTNNRKLISRLTLNCDRKSAGSVAVSYKDDDSTSITTGVTSLGSFDITAANPKIHRAGSFVGGRIWQFTHAEDREFRMESVTFDYEVGAH